MKCPVCSVNLVITDRNGVEIDYCPQCRGIWLDRGELDKIIERSNSFESQRRSDRDRDDRVYRESHSSFGQKQYQDKENYEYKKKKKESFLSDLFDF